MNKRVFVWAMLFLAVVALVLVGCAQKEAPLTEAAKLQKNRTGQGKAEQPKSGKREKEKAAAEEKIEEYGVSQEKAKEGKKKEPAQQGLRDKAKRILKKRIHFAFDSSVLSQKAQDALKSKAKILKKNPGLRLVIEGHCDERGTDEYNMALGERRARAAYEYSILLGVDADRMDLVSYGEERPLVEESNEEAWAKNRRDEFRIKR